MAHKDPSTPLSFSVSLAPRMVDASSWCLHFSCSSVNPMTLSSASRAASRPGEHALLPVLARLSGRNRCQMSEVTIWTFQYQSGPCYMKPRKSKGLINLFRMGQGQALSDAEPIRHCRWSSCLCPVILPRGEELQLQAISATCSAPTTQQSMRARGHMTSPSACKQTKSCPRECSLKSHWLNGSKFHHTSPPFF